MKQTRMTISVRGIFILCAVLAVCLVSGFFAWKQPTYAIGHFNLANNTWGTALFQDGLHTSVQINGFTYSTLGTTSVRFTRTQKTHTTMAFSRDDVIFDSEGNLYTESKESEIRTVETQSGISLKKAQNPDRTAITIPSSFYLINPHIPGMLTIQLTGIDTAKLNLEQKTITVPVHVTQIIVHAYTEIPTLKK